MISLKFIKGVLHQSLQMTPGGPWTDYNPVPSEGIEKSEVRLGECEMIKEKTGGEWPCCHMHGVSQIELYGNKHLKEIVSGDEIKCCPVCMLVRPKAKTLALKIQDHFVNNNWYITTPSNVEPYEVLADIANKHFEKESKHE